VIVQDYMLAKRKDGLRLFDRKLMMLSSRGSTAADEDGDYKDRRTRLADLLGIAIEFNHVIFAQTAYLFQLTGALRKEAERQGSSDPGSIIAKASELNKLFKGVQEQMLQDPVLRRDFQEAITLIMEAHTLEEDLRQGLEMRNSAGRWSCSASASLHGFMDRFSLDLVRLVKVEQDEAVANHPFSCLYDHKASRSRHIPGWVRSRSERYGQWNVFHRERSVKPWLPRKHYWLSEYASIKELMKEYLDPKRMSVIDNLADAFTKKYVCAAIHKRLKYDEPRRFMDCKKLSYERCNVKLQGELMDRISKMSRFYFDSSWMFGGTK